MKRDNIEFMVGWLDALRRDDRRWVVLASVRANDESTRPGWCLDATGGRG